MTTGTPTNSKQPKLTSGRPCKEALFEQFHIAVLNTFQSLEVQYQVVGLVAQVLGEAGEAASPSPESAERLRRNPAWASLSQLYDYAAEGLDHGQDPTDIVIQGALVLSLATSETHAPGLEWDSITAMADGRFAIDSGGSVAPHKLALLANVDLRTVRNAISAGDLEGIKSSDGILVENASARRWLLSRKGYKPTVAQAGPGTDQLSAM